MKMILENLESCGSEGWFSVLTSPAGPEPQAGEEFSFSLTSTGLNLGSSSCTGLLNAAFREKVVSKMERHRNTGEILVALEGESVICMAPPGKVSAASVRAFAFPQGTVLAMNSGTWHWIPFPLDKSGARFLVIFQDRTGDDDLEIQDLDKNIVL